MGWKREETERKRSETALSMKLEVVSGIQQNKTETGDEDENVWRQIKNDKPLVDLCIRILLGLIPRPKLKCG